jgi:hypothetical protein
MVYLPKECVLQRMIKQYWSHLPHMRKENSAQLQFSEPCTSSCTQIAKSSCPHNGLQVNFKACLGHCEGPGEETKTKNKNKTSSQAPYLFYLKIKCVFYLSRVISFLKFYLSLLLLHLVHH